MPTIKQLLEMSRKELLDLSGRNRLISIPVKSKSARIIEIKDELSAQVFKVLIEDKKSFSFLPGLPSRKEKEETVPVEGSTEVSKQEQEEEEIGLPQPEEEIDETTGLPKKHVDSRLQTGLTPEGLQSRLLSLFYDAQMMIEEQGVNVLYLALGHLKWFEASHSDIPRYAPLILIPVELSRKTASDRFHLRWREEDLQENLSLQAKLRQDFNINLPRLSDEESSTPEQYFVEVQKAISGTSGWEVLPNEMTLGFFSFAKFLMYRDLDSANWPTEDGLLKHPFITALLQDGFSASADIFSDNSHLDEVIPAVRLDHVVDADSSQTIAIESVRQGRNMVVEGPPGTGKSQSITNIISTAVLDGKKVLFVAEKMAALDVVKRRLEAEGLGPLCLELHSHKANKRAVIDEIGRTWNLGRPRTFDLEAFAAQLQSKRDYLNQHVKSLHEPYLPSGFTPFDIIGRLSILGERAKEVNELLFSNAEQWTTDQRIENRRLIQELAERVEEMGVPSVHPWRGSCRDTVLRIDLEAIETKIRNLNRHLTELLEILEKLSALIFQPVASTFHEASLQRLSGEFIVKAPAVDKQALCADVWDTGLDGISELLTHGKNYASIISDIGAKVDPKIWDKEFSEIRVQMVGHGKSLFRVFNKQYREAIVLFRGHLLNKLPKRYDERLALLNSIIAGQLALRSIRQGETLGKSAFGSFWNNEKTNWIQTEAILDWVRQQRQVGLDKSFLQSFVKVEEIQQVQNILKKIDSCDELVSREIYEVIGELKLDLNTAFGMASIEQVFVKEFLDRCAVWLSQMEDLSRWNGYYVRAKKARENGLSQLVEKIESGEVQVQLAVDAFDRIYHRQLLRSLIEQKPQLAQFDGVLHWKHVEEFKKLDKERLLLAKYRTLMKHHVCMPPSNTGIGVVGIVRSEMERKRGHRPVRKLLKDAGSVVQAIKPVFMMSPLSVAQYLEPGAVEFDLLVIDEASQVQPIDAFGALARCKQMVVVGDSRQLPPTRFFARLNEDSTEEPEDGQIAQAKDIESILGLCNARGVPSKMLRWHYRSRHQSLIAVSNHEFYENRLFIVPSPYSISSGLGLKFVHVPDGVFDRGGSSTNRIEAREVCKAIIEHARKNPAESLGVAAFSIKQQKLILDELELLRRECPDTESFFASHPTEPFFVKNLENVQGDERDVIFISVGYGRDKNGYMAMNFGPLSNEGGERRLNVLISRAKKQCVVFSSITADDIDLQRVTGRGVKAFKVFLNFAKTGRLDIARETGREEDSPFEEAVRQAIESQGYEVHPQVGIAGFFIDLAVLAQDGSGRYLLGIECDGAAYHSSRSARDRDRLRQAVLEDHGWIIHRIWSFDWFQRPQEQLRKILESIERAKATLDEVNLAKFRPEVILEINDEEDHDIEREIMTDKEESKVVNLSLPYVEAKFEIQRNINPHELPTREMSDIILRIVEIEGPVHEDEIVVRIRNLWGLGRAGNRIQDAVSKGVRSLLVSKRSVRKEECLCIPDSPILIRNRANVTSASLRKPEMLPIIEIRSAIKEILDVCHGSSRKEIVYVLAQLFGFKSVSSQFKSTITDQIDWLIKKDELEEIDEIIKIKVVNAEPDKIKDEVS